MTPATISVTPSGKACLDHVAAGLIAHAERVFKSGSMPACPAPKSDLVRPSRRQYDFPDYTLPAHVIAAIGGVL